MKTTKSQEVADDVVALLRARAPLLWVITTEEARAERYIIEAAVAAKFLPLMWDTARRVADIGGKSEQRIGSKDPSEMLAAIQERAAGGDRTVWIMRDLPVWLAGFLGASTLRQLRNLARFLPSTPLTSQQAIVILTPLADIPPELAGHVNVVTWPLPDRAEIAGILDAAIKALPDELKASAAPDGQREAAIDAAVGLSGEEVQCCFSRSLVRRRCIDPVIVAGEKRSIVAREGVLEWFEPHPAGLAAVGGLDNLKSWLESRRVAHSPRARAYGLPTPRGALLVGIPGCGKSLIAKAIATAWGVPLLRLDLGSLKSKFVGESEGNLRKAFRVIETIGRCVVWLDEIEKSLQGATSGSADGGTSSDQLGAILSWMQERGDGGAFVVATANDIETLPSELLRKGRFDDIWFVDLPNEREREEILAATLRSYGRPAANIDIRAVARTCEGFTGAEIAALVIDALYAAFTDAEREITTADLTKAAATVVPLSKTVPEKIARTRKWAEGRARPATSNVIEIGVENRVRALDI